jgi:mannan endo-1,4-beta-mannosidase
MVAVGSGTANASVLQVNTGSPYLCANVKGAATTDGTPVLAWDCNGDFNEQWEYAYGQFLGLGTTGGTSKCLDVYGAGTNPGTAVILYHCTGGANQEWEIFNGALLGFPNTTVIYGTQSGLCLDSLGGFGKQLTIEYCNGSKSQNWKVE